MVTQRLKNYIYELYTNVSNPSSFTSPYKIFHHLKKHKKFDVTLKQVKEVLATIPIYVEHRKVNRKGKKAISICPRKTYMMYSDCCHLTAYKAQNNNYGYFIVFCNCMTKVIKAEALKDLTGESVSKALEKYLKKNKFEFAYTDGGSEYKSKLTQAIFSKYGVTHITAFSGQKSFLAESAIKQVKSKLVKYMEFNHTQKWWNVLDKVVSSLNSTPHKTLNFLSPNQASKLKNYQLWEILYEKNKTKKSKFEKLKKLPSVPNPFKFDLGDKIKISKEKKTFEKSYTSNFSKEVFEICYRELKSRVPIYKIKDSNNELIIGIFYTEELVLVEKAKKAEIDHILKKKIIFGKEFCLVRWKNGNASSDSFILCSEVKQMKQK